jgi:hypothetical protein
MTAAATLFVASGATRSDLLQIARDTGDAAIAQRQRADGAFAPPAGDTQPDAIATVMFGVELGATYLQVQSYLPEAERQSWASALGRAAQFLINNGNMTWYTNGNISLANVELQWMAWRATGSQVFGDAYERGLAFVLSPPQSRWAGFGLILSRVPAAADGSDGAGYLAESGGSTPGFDPEYTQLQLDVATRLWLLSGDPRVLRLVNLLTNQLLPRVDASLRLDTSGGTRHDVAGATADFCTPGVAVLAQLGGRGDLVALANRQMLSITTLLHTVAGFANVGYYRALGNEWSVILTASRDRRVGAALYARLKPKARSASSRSSRRTRARRARRR